MRRRLNPGNAVPCVYDVLVDVIHPVHARAGQVVVVRGDEVAVVCKGSAQPLRRACVTPAAVAALVQHGVLCRRGRAA